MTASQAPGSRNWVDRLVRIGLFLSLWFILGMGVLSVLALVAGLGMGASTKDLAAYQWISWVSWAGGLALTFVTYRMLVNRQGD